MLYTNEEIIKNLIGKKITVYNSFYNKVDPIVKNVEIIQQSDNYIKINIETLIDNIDIFLLKIVKKINRFKEEIIFDNSNMFNNIFQTYNNMPNKEEFTISGKYIFQKYKYDLYRQKRVKKNFILKSEIEIKIKDKQAFFYYNKSNQFDISLDFHKKVRLCNYFDNEIIQSQFTPVYSPHNEMEQNILLNNNESMEYALKHFVDYLLKKNNTHMYPISHKYIINKNKDIFDILGSSHSGIKRTLTNKRKLFNDKTSIYFDFNIKEVAWIQTNFNVNRLLTLIENNE